MRDRLERRCWSASPDANVNGAGAPRVPNTTNISFDGVEAESLLIALDLEGIAVSTGSACSSGTLEPSHVLKAMNLPAGRSQNAIRFSLGSGTTDEEIDRLLGLLPAIVEKLRSLARVPRALTARSARRTERRSLSTIDLQCALSSPCPAEWTPRSRPRFFTKPATTWSALSMQLYDQRERPDTVRPLLLARRSARRAARRRGDRHQALRPQSRASVSRHRRRQLRRRVHRGPHADSLHAIATAT